MPVTRLIDVSHEVTAGMVTVPGLPAPVVSDFLSREDSRAHYSHGTTFQIGRIELVANTGTYIDSPFHRFEDGVDLAGLDLSRLADLDGIVVDARGATLEDLGSKNGTLLGGAKIHGAIGLNDRDEIRVGPARLVFRLYRRAGSTATASESAKAAPRHEDRK